MLVAAMPPALMNLPPTKRSVPEIARAFTPLHWSSTAIPDPKADQLLPFHLATFVAAVPPAEVNQPPAYRSLPDTARANTSLFSPEPKADQLLPSHFAMLVAAVPPAVVKKPPTYKLVPDTASAFTDPP